MLFYSGIMHFPLSRHEICQSFLGKPLPLGGHKFCYRFLIKLFPVLEHKIY